MSSPWIIHVPISSCVVGDVLVVFPAGTALHVADSGHVTELYGFPERRRFTLVAINGDQITVRRQKDNTEHTYTGDPSAWVYREESSRACHGNGVQRRS